ncbi:calcium-binding protein [Paraburkholderia bonniea]|uniref:calcium-binding protein n=1 Tax=Paraburkholderia bonniea TaxID=2152891 RepID=UPI0015801B96|nr:calcium-binding protein [Paraburkholderia bonniea]
MKKILIGIGLAAVIFWAGCLREGNKKPAEPGIGSMNGVRLVIPADYQFFMIQYEGDRIWANPPVRHPPGPDVPIVEFTLLLHYPDFSPLNRSNQASWLGIKGSKAKNDEWIVVGVEPDVQTEKDPSVWFPKMIGRFLDGENTEVQPELFFGLVSEKGKKIIDSEERSGEKEYFYDPGKTIAYIECNKYAVASCKHWFAISEIKAIVKIRYSKNNLKDWRKIQEKITGMIASFENGKTEKEIVNVEEGYDLDKRYIDVVRFDADIRPQDLTVSRELYTSNIVIKIDGSHTELRIIDQLVQHNDEYVKGIEQFVFADGTIWDKQTIAEKSARTPQIRSLMGWAAGENAHLHDPIGHMWKKYYAAGGKRAGEESFYADGTAPLPWSSRKSPGIAGNRLANPAVISPAMTEIERQDEAFYQAMISGYAKSSATTTQSQSNRDSGLFAQPLIAVNV